MLELPERIAYNKIVQTGRLAERLGADILGLGAFTSVVGDGGLTVASRLDIPVTTGDAYTISIAVRAIQKAAKVMDIEIANATAAIVGATGAIGQVCATLMANKVSELYLIGRDHNKLEDLKAKMAQRSGAKLRTSTDLSILKNAQLIISVSSAAGSLIKPEHLRPGSVICDVARPRDVSAKVAAAREDVLVIDGGMVDLPGDVNFNFDFGFPPGKAYACMAETIALTLEGRLEDYTLGKNIQQNRVDEITSICDKHGFRLSGFRSFEKAVTDDQINKVRYHAQKGA